MFLRLNSTYSTNLYYGQKHRPTGRAVATGAREQAPVIRELISDEETCEPLIRTCQNLGTRTSHYRKTDFFSSGEGAVCTGTHGESGRTSRGFKSRGFLVFAFAMSTAKLIPRSQDRGPRAHELWGLL